MRMEKVNQKFFSQMVGLMVIYHSTIHKKITLKTYPRFSGCHESSQGVPKNQLYVGAQKGWNNPSYPFIRPFTGVIPPRSLRFSPLKAMMVGRRSGFLLGFGNFSGENSLLNFGRINPQKISQGKCKNIQQDPLNLPRKKTLSIYLIATYATVWGPLG